MLWIILLLLICISSIILICYLLTNPRGTEELKAFQGPPTQWVFGNALQFPKEIAGMRIC